MKQLVLQLPSAELRADTVLSWYVFNSAAELLAGGRSALMALQSALAGEFDGGATWVLVPGSLVTLASVRIPSRQVRQIKQALPYMVEELIADNIEEVHLALPAKLDEGEQVPVAIVRHHLLIDWLDQLYQHGVRPDFLGPDSLAVPWRENSRSFFLERERFIYRGEEFNAQVLFRNQLESFLDLLAQQPPGEEITAVPRYIVYSGAETKGEARSVAGQIQARLGQEITVTEYEESASEVLAATAIRERDQLINLLQGGYKVQKGEGGRAWRKAALVAGFGALAYAVIAGASGLWFSWRGEQVEEQTFALYRELFPQERRVVSPKKQMLGHLRSQGTVALSPLPLLAKTALGLRGNGVELDELHYRQQQNDLQLQLRTPSLESLDQVKQALGGVGLGVEINSAVQQGEGTLSRVNVRENPS